MDRMKSKTLSETSGSLEIQCDDYGQQLNTLSEVVIDEQIHRNASQVEKKNWWKRVWITK